MFRRLVISLFLTFGLALAGLVAIAPSAVAQPTATAQFAARGTLVAKGAAVVVRVRYTCPEGAEPFFLDVRVTQRVGGRVADGFGFVTGTNLTCDGTQHTAVVRVAAIAGGAPFRAGDALAQGILLVCDESGCAEVQFSRVIEIVRR
jgi:hypothetical protein